MECAVGHTFPCIYANNTADRDLPAHFHAYAVTHNFANTRTIL